MKRKTCIIFALVFALFLSVSPLFMHANADGVSETYATIPHETQEAGDGSFVTAFSIVFMILTVIVCAVVMFIKR